MKQILRIFLVTSLFAGIINSTEAQRRMGSNEPVVRRSFPTGNSQPAERDFRSNPSQSSNANQGASANRIPERSFQPATTSRQNNTFPNSREQRALTPVNPEVRRNVPQTIAPDRNNIRSSSPERNFEQRTPSQNSIVSGTNPPQRNFEQRTPSQNNVVSGTNAPQRNIVSTQNYNRVNSLERNNSRYNNSYYNNSNYNRDNYNRNNYYRTRYHQPNFMYGPRYTVIPRSSISIYFGGSPYYYTNGYYYGYYGGYYQPVFPPFGLRIGTLPFGYSRFFIGGDTFFYYNGIYYREFNDNSYEVVDAPIGATVSSLPRGAKSVIVNGEELYELNGTYYKEDRNSKGKKVYTVVGKNGEINNSVDEEQFQPSTPGSLEIGEIVNQLPEGSKVVTINGEQLYVTPGGTYLHEEINNNITTYKVVGN